MQLFRKVRLMLGAACGAMLVLAATGCSNSVEGNGPKSGEANRDGSERPRQATEQPAAATTVPKTVPVAAAAEGEWGTIKGQVIFGGDKPPKLPALNVDKDGKECLVKGPLT